MNQKAPFGYQWVNGEIVPHPLETSITKYYVEKIHEYSQNPPDVLVQEVISAEAAEGRTFSAEEAKSKVTFAACEALVLKGIHALPEWQAHLTLKRTNEKIENVAVYVRKSDPHSEITPILTEEEQRQICQMQMN